MNKANHILSAACLSLALSLSSCTTESTESPPPPSSSVLPSSGSGGGSSGTFTDTRDSRIYKLVKIGDQTWMAENLNYDASGSVCYDNSASNCNTYGRLYDWSTALSACPDGWHLPSDSEWSILVKYADPSATGDYSNVAGTKLKATSGWYSGGNDTDEFGFSALPGGRGHSGSFNDVGNYGDWWSATQYNTNYAYLRRMHYSLEYVRRFNDFKSFLASVRCLQG